MDPERLRRLLQEVRRGRRTVDAALEELGAFPIEAMEHAALDTHRELRTGTPEVVLAEHKSAVQVRAIVRTLARRGRVLVTRLGPEKARAVVRGMRRARYDPVSRTLIVGGDRAVDVARGPIAIVTAGTSDRAAAEEAAVTAGFLGNPVERVYDVGVAGIHRLFARRDVLRRASVLIVLAGMEGALPSVVAGLVAAPVVAVPTSVGYGASFGGLAALLTMLNSCAPNVAVVNIDNGFGAAVVANLINRR